MKISSVLAGMAILVAASGNGRAEVLPYIPLKGDFGGANVTDVEGFIPNIGDYTLQMSVPAGCPVGIAFGNVEHTMEDGGMLRVAATTAQPMCLRMGCTRRK